MSSTLMIDVEFDGNDDFDDDWDIDDNCDVDKALSYRRDWMDVPSQQLQITK